MQIQYKIFFTIFSFLLPYFRFIMSRLRDVGENDWINNNFATYAMHFQFSLNFNFGKRKIWQKEIFFIIFEWHAYVNSPGDVWEREREKIFWCWVIPNTHKDFFNCYVKFHFFLAWIFFFPSWLRFCLWSEACSKKLN